MKRRLAGASRQRLLEPFPMVRVCHRALEPDYHGPVFVWDIDKTYLDTHFSQFKHLMRIPFESGVDKEAVVGAVDLLHALRSGPSGREHRPLFFVSASPPQIARSIEKKMLLDGVEYDGITYKDWLALARRGHLAEMKEQVAFKTAALLSLLADMPDGASLYLFGDDAEKDASIYCVFAEIAAGRLRGGPLEERLVAAGARASYARALRAFAEALPGREAVEGMYINLVRCPDGSSVREHAGRVAGYATAAGALALLRARGLVA